MLAIWSSGHVQVFKLAALIPLITAVPNGREGGGGVRCTGEVESDVPSSND